MTRETARQFADAISRALPSQGDGVSSGSGASSGPVASVSEELQRLASLRDSGVLTEEEFVAQKSKLLE